MNTEIQELKNEIAGLKEQLQNYIPRRRVRRVYKMLGDILEQDTDNTLHINILKEFIKNIQDNGTAVAGQEIKTAVEHLLSVRER